MPNAKYSRTIFDPTGNPRSGLGVYLTGSKGQFTLVEDPLRTGLYYQSVPQGTYDIYIGGAKDDELSPLWHDTDVIDDASHNHDATYLKLDASNDPLTGALSGSSADFSDALTVGAVDVSLSTHNHDAAYLKLDASNDPLTGPLSGSSADFSDALTVGAVDVSLSTHDHDYAYITGSHQVVTVGETAVTDHEAALSITESQISDLDHNATSLSGSAISTTPPTSGQALVFNGSSYVPASTGSFGDSDARWFPLGPWQDSLPTGAGDDAASISYVTDNQEDYASGSAAGTDIYYKGRVKYVYDGTHTTIRLRYDGWYVGDGFRFDPEGRIYVDGSSKVLENITDTGSGTNNSLDWTISGLTVGNAYELQFVLAVNVGSGGLPSAHEAHINPKKTMFYVK